ncbi:MAG: amidohydrolase family protein [Candidatus Izemoplasmatales bacterium]
MVYALINAQIYDYHTYLENGYVVFDKKIIEVGSMKNYRNIDYNEINCKGKIIIPSFVSGHTHLYSAFARGMSFDFNPKDFVEILKQLWWKLDYFLDKDLIYYSAIMGALEQLSMGTTTLIDHHASQKVDGSLDLIKKALNDSVGMRGILAFETSDRFNVSDAVKENVNFIKNNRTSIISGLFGLHASLSLSDESLRQVSDNLNDEGIHIHVAESIMDEDDCLDKYKIRVVERLEKFNLLNEKSLLVHCTHINEKEMDIIKKYNATIAVNVTSNLNNAVGISQIKKFLDKGIRVISGNDGLIPSQAIEYLNIFYLSHLKENSPIGFSLDDLKTIILNTYDYANMILKTNLGRLDVASEADLMVVDFNPYTLVDKSNIFGHLFYGVFPSLKPEMVVAKGNILIKDYNFVNDNKELYEKALNKANELWKKIKEEGNNIEFKY